MKKKLLFGASVGAMVLCGCSGLNPAQDRANTIAKAQAECEKHGEMALIEDVRQDPDGSGGYYTTVRSHCVPKSVAPNVGSMNSKL